MHISNYNKYSVEEHDNARGVRMAVSLICSQLIEIRTMFNTDYRFTVISLLSTGYLFQMYTKSSVHIRVC